MPAKLLVMSAEENGNVLLQGKEFLGGTQETQVRNEALELQELLLSVTDTIGSSIQTESKLTIELSGSVKIGGSLEVGIPQFFALNLFKVKGEGGKEDAIKKYWRPLKRMIERGIQDSQKNKIIPDEELEKEIEKSLWF
jgi:hypothetical protein